MIAAAISPLAWAEAAPAISVAPPINEERMFGVMPNYQTVNDPNAAVAPLTVRQKWTLVAKQTYDPFNMASAALAAGLSQAANETPKYGHGGSAYAERFGAAMADFGTQSAFSTGLLASIFHQDPRYFRMGPGKGVFHRVAYSLSRIVVTRQDSGAAAFNVSGIGGMMLGIAASNAYYPAASVHGSVMAGRLTTSLTGGVMGNLMSEFWPDIQRRFFRHGRGR